MFEIVDNGTRGSRARPSLGMQAVRVLTRWQQLRLAELAALAGALGALAGVAWLDRYFPAPVEIVAPRIEHSGELLEVVRFGLSYRGVESGCRLVIFKGRDQWSLHCL